MQLPDFLPAGGPIEGEASYQGLPCLSAEFTATPGGTSDTGSVVIAARSMSALRIAVGKALFSDRPFPRVPDTIPREPASKPPSGVSVEVGDGVVERATLAPFGTLVLRSSWGERRIDGLMPIEIEPIDQDDEGLVLYRIRLGDVRTIWPHRGALFGDWNHVSDNGAPVAHVATASLAFLLEWIGAALPGIERLELSPAAEAAAKATQPPNIRWRFENPARELERFLRDHDLHMVLQPDGRTVKVYGRADGVSTPAGLGIPEELLCATAAPSLTLVPDAVLIVGAPRQHEVELTLTGSVAMVGMTANEDDIVPWTDALFSYGLNAALAGRWVLQKPEKQAAMLAALGDVTEVEAKRRADRLRKWLYRWYRIPAELTHTLPVLPLLDPETGEEQPPRVWADAIGEFDDEDSGGTGRIWGNISNAPVDPEKVQVDAAAGILRFGTAVPPGYLLDTAIQTLEEGTLYPPTIRFRYRHERKDGLLRSGDVKDKTVPYAVAPEDFFLFALERQGTEARETEPLELEASPLVISAPELVELERLDGSSNRQELRRHAFELASGYFRQQPVVTTYDVKAAGIHPVWPDGAVAQVRWRVSEHEASTEVVINSYRRSIDGGAPTYAQKQFVGTVARGYSVFGPRFFREKTARGPGRRT